MPPGTGDIQLTLSQRVPVSGAVIVTTPQDIALLDARKGLRMFQKVNVPVLGIVENMSTHVCSQLRPRGADLRQRRRRAHGGAVRRRLLGQLPLDIRIREETDGGRPTVVADPDGPHRPRLPRGRRAARRRACSVAAGSGRAGFPRITVEDNLIVSIKP